MSGKNGKTGHGDNLHHDDGDSEFTHTLDRKSMSHGSLLVLPKPVKAGMTSPTRYSYRNGIRQGRGSVNLSNQWNSNNGNNGNMQQNESSVNNSWWHTPIQKSRSTMGIRESLQSSWNADGSVLSRNGIESRGSIGGTTASTIACNRRDGSENCDHSRTPSPMLDRVIFDDIVGSSENHNDNHSNDDGDDGDGGKDKDNSLLLPERTTSPRKLHSTSSFTKSNDSSPEILQVASEIQNILFQQQRKSIEEKDISKATLQRKSMDLTMSTDSHRVGFEPVHISKSEMQHPFLDEGSIFEFEIEETYGESRHMDEVNRHYDYGNSFHAFDYDEDDFEMDDQHMTSISTDAIQHYLEEYSLHDNCPSPPVRVPNGVAFDDYFLHRNVSQFSVGSFERTEGSIIGAEIGLFNLSPVSSHGIQQVR